MKLNISKNKQFNFFIIVVILVTTIFSSCERDEICIDDITPKLIIRTYDNETRDNIKIVENLSVVVLDLETPIDTLKFSKDSIYLPIRVDKNETRYEFIKKTEDNTLTDIVTLSYNTEEAFVGRACGIKAIFKNVKIETNSTNWIKFIQTFNLRQETIDNETSAHVKIFH